MSKIAASMNMGVQSYEMSDYGMYDGDILGIDISIEISRQKF